MNPCRWKLHCSDPPLCPRDRDEGEGVNSAAITSCLDCPNFWRDIHQLDHNDGEGMVPPLADALLEAQGRINRLSLQLQDKSREVDFLHDVGIFLQGSLGRDEVIAMALTAVTAGKGFGLNRAILLLVDEEERHLLGYLAVGPRTPDEAWRIWQEVAEHDYSLKDMARRFLREKMAGEREKFRDLLEILKTPLEQSGHLFVRTLQSRQSFHMRDPQAGDGLPLEQAAWLAARELVLVPLVSGDHRIGLLLADNFVTGEPIDDDAMHSLETFALPVSYAIERASLYERLNQELERIREAHRKLHEQQQQIVRMERLALVGEMSSDIAHQIRNPLAIIGGYARQLIKESRGDENGRSALEAILREAARIGDTVSNLLDYEDLRHPARDVWDLCQTIHGVVRARSEELEAHGIVCNLSCLGKEEKIVFDLKKIDYVLRTVINRSIERLSFGGQLEIGTEHEGENVKIWIADSGAPLSHEEIAAIFTPLYTEGGGDIRPDLELALCARILAQQHGRLEIWNRPEGGMVHVLILPLYQEVTHG